MQSLRTLFWSILRTLTLNRVAPKREDQHEFELPARKTPLQAKAFELLGENPERIDSNKQTV